LVGRLLWQIHSGTVERPCLRVAHSLLEELLDVPPRDTERQQQG